MKKIYEDLWQTELKKPFADLNTHAYFIMHKEGNILIYNTSHAEDLKEIEKLGGLKTQCLSHRHEDGESIQTIKEIFSNKLYIDELEAPYIKHGEITNYLSEKTEIHSDFFALPTPGHTDGGFSYWYESPLGLNYLFTGDTFFQWNSRWSTLVLSKEGGDPYKVIDSLKIYLELKPDTVLCSASVGETSIVEVNQEQWHEAINNNIHRLQKQIERTNNA